MVLQQIIRRKQKISRQIEEIRIQIKKLPDGKLNCAGNGKYCKWYKSDGKSKIYIPKENKKLAEQLAQKKYLMLLESDLQQEIKAIDAYLKKIPCGLGEAERLLTEPSEYQNLLSSSFKSSSQELLEWQNVPYETNQNYTENLIIKTSSGHFVRSKSEAMIDLALYKRKIPFRYECALQLGKMTIYPDFTIRHPDTGIVYYWEHFGKMDDPDYARKAYKKLQSYNQHGIIQSIHLITTFETKEYPLDTETVERLIEQYFG